MTHLAMCIGHALVKPSYTLRTGQWLCLAVAPTLTVSSSAIGVRQNLIAAAWLANTQGATEMGQMEHLLNVYAAKAAAGSVADFMGYIEVSEEEASTRLTPGLWLVRGELVSHWPPHLKIRADTPHSCLCCCCHHLKLV